MVKWQCSVCGYIHDGDNAPENCPKCGVPKEKFEKLSEDIASLVERSRYTNDLHMGLLALMDEAILICEEGIEDDLDPGCVSVFETTLESAKIVKQKIKAELKGHMSKNKWG